MRSPAGRTAGFALAVVVVLLVVPTVTATETTLLARLPLHLDGDVQADAVNATVRVAALAGQGTPHLDLAFTAAQARVIVTNWTNHDRADCDSPLGGILCSADGESDQAMPEAVRDVEFLIRELRPEFTLVLFDGSMAGGNYTVHPLEDPRLDVTVDTEQASYTDDPVDLDFNRPVAPDSIKLIDTATRYEVQGDFTFMVYGAELTAVTPDRTYTYETGTWAQRTEVQDTHVSSQRTTQYVRVEVTDAVLTLRAAGGLQDLYARAGEVVVNVDGAIRAQGAAGTLQIGDQTVRPRGDRVEAHGTFTLSPTYVVPGSSKQVMFALDGHIQTLAVGTQTYLGEEAAVVAVAATGATVLLAGLGAYFWPSLKMGLVVPLYAKLTKARVLDQGTRSLVHAKVEQDPGCQVKQVADALDISWTTAAYHLRVLTKMGLIVAKKSGRHEHYFMAGSQAVAGHAVMAALQNDTARQIVELVLRSPGIIQKDISDRLGIAPSTASGHLARLRDVGAVREEREWKKRRYFAGEALDRVPLHLTLGTPHENGSVAATA